MKTETIVASTPRAVVQTLRGQPASDGAGVKLTRVIGQPRLPDLDPFLLKDHVTGFTSGRRSSLRPAEFHRLLCKRVDVTAPA